MQVEVLDKPRNRVLDQVTINKAVQANVEGKPQTVIAKELGVSQNAISKHLRKPANIALAQRLRETLQRRHVHKFISRVVKTEKIASQLNDYALGLADINDTKYKDIEDIEKMLTRVDKTGLAILKGVGILDTNTIHFGDNIDNSDNRVMSNAYMQFIDFQADNGYKDDETNENNAE